VVIVGFGLLSRWQWSRAEAKRTDRIALDSASLAQPSPLPTDQKLDEVREWSRFTATGIFDAKDQVVVRKRPLNGTNGFWVMTLLEMKNHQSIWVNRGWMPTQGVATSLPKIPAPASGQSTITGAWREFETASAADLTGLPVGMIPAPAPEVLPVQASSPGYLQLTAPNQPGLQAVETPEIDEGQNVSYAVQWILFAIVAIVGWFIFLRREAADDERRMRTNQ
jgi:cytochrome oxidase assembly protein ShyY1